MRRLTRRARARADYLGYVAGREWPIALSAAGIVLGVVTVLPSAVGVALSVVALGLGVVGFTRDVRQLRRRWTGFEFTTIAAPFPTGEFPPPPAYGAASYVAVPARGTMLVSDVIDESLRDEHAIAVAEEPYRLPSALRATAPHVLPLRARGRLLFNGHVLGMHGEPLPRTGGRPAPIPLHRARFFDAMCSNELGTLRIVRTDTGAEYDLRRAELADVVGVSTVAFTADDQLIAVRQSALNSASRLLLAPSGSGSLEPKDVGDTLSATVRAGMERELCEETAIRPAEIAATTVVGFGRWMERGAKPEFFGLTRLTVDGATVAARRPPGEERLYTAGIVLMSVDLAALAEELAGGTPLAEATSLPARLREDGSLPLLLALRAAARWRHDG